MFIIKLLSEYVSGIIMPISGHQDCILPHMVFCTGCAGCGCVQLGRELCALCEGYCSALVVLAVVVCSWVVSCVHCVKITVGTVTFTQYRTPYAVIHGLFLLMMGLMMPETCWDRSLIINIRLVASCWFISLRPTFEDSIILMGCINIVFISVFFNCLTVADKAETCSKL